MSEFPRPIIYSSKCLGFCACWWNGTTIFNDCIEGIKDHVDFVTHCPEVEIGLGAPRKFLRIVMVDGEKRFVQPATEGDFTDEINDFIDETVSNLGPIDGFVLRESSPSCSIKGVKYYASPDRSSAVKGTGPGLFGGAVLEKYDGLPIESDGRLKNNRIRDGFLTRVYLAASLRQVEDLGQMRDLVDFHSDNKYLLMSFGQKYVKALGNIVANADKKPFERVIERYWEGLKDTMKTGQRRASIANVMMKMFGYFSKKLSDREKTYFLKRLEEYRSGRASLPRVREILRLWNLRFEDEYIMRQTVFEPFPESLEDSREMEIYLKEQLSE